MHTPVRIVFTVTNDLIYDQRMGRICTSLAENGYDVTLVGVKRRASTKLLKHKYDQKRIPCYFQKGKLFYVEYNIKLFFRLLFIRHDVICAIDLDTILPCLFSSFIGKKIRIYDAHELFCEMQEIVSRPAIRTIWKGVEKLCLPFFKNGYSVSENISRIYGENYGHRYETIRNVPILELTKQTENPRENFLLYQGALNFGRGIPNLLEAMRDLEIPLVICGEGNFSKQARDLVSQKRLSQKVLFKGMVLPDQLGEYTNKALIGINLGENTCLSIYYSLNNKFFDYMHAGLPQVAMNYPEFRKINEEYEIAYLIDDLDPKTIGSAISKLIEDKEYYLRLAANCLRGRFVFNWQTEEKKLLEFYEKLSHTLK